eukprot:TCONS_00027435-protein
MADVYDGEMWKRFSDPDEHDFFTKKGNYGLMLNVDWFNPYKHVKYSIGAIYLVIMNLPRSERFKPKNIILVGLIPSMAKEPANINSFLEPLVCELKEAWTDGFILKLGNAFKTFGLALLCIGCDIPACRKLCGFLGHAAVKGCSKCEKEFPGRNCGGFDRDLWRSRTNEGHRRQMEEIKRAETIGEKQRLESLYGTRYSVLTELPYVDLIKMSVVDPMHNLFLGTSKLMIKIWKENGYLDHHTFPVLQSRVDSAVVSSDVGKLPTKLESGFDGFTADELKNCTLIYSIYALKGIIPEADLECWRLFVIACTYLCARVITLEDIELADTFLLRFCRRFQRLYTSDRVTPNIHLHGHLKECLQEFGPVYSFWLFSFERYNGLLGDLPNNKKNIECQIMKRFLRDHQVMNFHDQNQVDNDFHELKRLSCDLMNRNTNRGTLNDQLSSDYIPHMMHRSRNFDFQNQKCWMELDYFRFSRKLQPYTLNEEEFRMLKMTYSSLYPTDYHNLLVPQTSWKTTELVYGENLLGSVKSRSHKSSYVSAFWASSDGSIQAPGEMYLKPVPGQIVYFIKHNVFFGDEHYPHVFAKISWFLESDKRDIFGKPVEVWDNVLTKPKGASSFMPVQRTFAKFVHFKFEKNCQKLMAVVPRAYCLRL